MAPSDDGLADAFVLVPWARGNYGVQQTSEGDVLALIDAMIDRYPIDLDAVSLTGFSLGGAGAFSLALHAPSRFNAVAVAIASGGTWQVPLGRGLGRNVAHIPFFLWHGGADNIVPVQEQNLIIAELKAGKATHEAHIETVAGHTLSQAVRGRMLDFVLNKRRAPFIPFAYVADGPYQRGRNGISLRYDARLSTFPSVSVSHKGLDIRIDARGSDGLEIAQQQLSIEANQSLDIALHSLTLGHGDVAPQAVGTGAARP